jgi:hypothetical protein
LIAPFAFLRGYDKVLTDVYTRITPEDVARSRSIIAAIENDGMADNRFMAFDLKFIDQPPLDAAAEYANGRLLLIGTTDLRHQPVIWNGGRRQWLTPRWSCSVDSAASAAIPGGPADHDTG